MEENCFPDLDLYLTQNPVPRDFENTLLKYVNIHISIQIIILKLTSIYSQSMEEEFFKIPSLTFYS